MGQFKGSIEDINYGLKEAVDKAVVEQLGSERASGLFASLKVVEIPDGVEWIAEKHRTWD